MLKRQSDHAYRCLGLSFDRLSCLKSYLGASGGLTQLDSIHVIIITKVETRGPIVRAQAYQTTNYKKSTPFYSL